MSLFFNHRNTEIRESIGRYLTAAGEAVTGMTAGLRHYARHGLDAHFEQLTASTHLSEDDADSIRREIEIALYAKSLLPDSREDILLLLERADLIPNQAEDVLRQLQIQNIQLPPLVHDPLIELAALGEKAFGLVAQGVGEVLDGRPGIRDITRLIDDAEGAGDQLEQQTVARLFRGDLSLPEKMQARDIINMTGAICDFAQDVGIFLTIFSVKRHE